MAVASLTFGQLSRIVLQPNGGGNPQVFLNFDDAFNAAQANDRIYLSGGGFQSTEQIIIDFPIHLIGAGIHPDSTVVTNMTTLNTADPIIIMNGGSNSTFSGIKFSSQTGNNFNYGDSDASDDPTGLFFERCEFMDGIRVTNVSFNDNSDSESTFNECVFFGSIGGAENSAVNLTKCVFGPSSGVNAIDGGALIVDHCVFFGNSNIANSIGSTVRNTIFRSATISPLYQCNGSSVQNCLTLAAQFFGNSSGSISNSITGATNPFVDETNNNFDYTDNLAVDINSPASGGALDGTDMGLYGSSFPAKLGAVPYNPHFIEVEISPATDGNGNLPVTIKAQAQTY